MRPAMSAHCLLCYWYMILLFEYGSIQDSLPKNAIFLPGVAKKSPYFYNSYHPAGLKCESGAWPKLRDGK